MSVAGRLAQQNSTQQRRIDGVAQAKRHVLEYPLANKFPWDKISFGWSYVLTTGSAANGKVRILAGDIIKATYTPVSTVDTDVTIATTPTYVGVKCYRDMTNAAIFTDSSKPVNDDTWFKRWFYIFQTLNNKAILKLVGTFPGNVDITGYGD